MPLIRQYRAVLLHHPVGLPREFGQLRVGLKEIAFLSVIPILPDEQEYAIEQGPYALADRLAEAGVTDLLEPRRKSAVGNTSA